MNQRTTRELNLQGKKKKNQKQTMKTKTKVSKTEKRNSEINTEITNSKYFCRLQKFKCHLLQQSFVYLQSYGEHLHYKLLVVEFTTLGDLFHNIGCSVSMWMLLQG